MECWKTSETYSDLPSLASPANFSVRKIPLKERCGPTVVKRDEINRHGPKPLIIDDGFGYLLSQIQNLTLEENSVRHSAVDSLTKESAHKPVLNTMNLDLDLSNVRRDRRPARSVLPPHRLNINFIRNGDEKFRAEIRSQSSGSQRSFNTYPISMNRTAFTKTRGQRDIVRSTPLDKAQTLPPITELPSLLTFRQVDLVSKKQETECRPWAEETTALLRHTLKPNKIRGQSQDLWQPKRSHCKARLTTLPDRATGRPKIKEKHERGLLEKDPVARYKKIQEKLDGGFNPPPSADDAFSDIYTTQNPALVLHYKEPLTFGLKLPDLFSGDMLPASSRKRKGRKRRLRKIKLCSRSRRSRSKPKRSRSKAKTTISKTQSESSKKTKVNKWPRNLEDNASLTISLTRPKVFKMTKKKLKRLRIDGKPMNFSIGSNVNDMPEGSDVTI